MVEGNIAGADDADPLRPLYFQFDAGQHLIHVGPDFVEALSGQQGFGVGAPAVLDVDGDHRRTCLRQFVHQPGHQAARPRPARRSLFKILLGYGHYDHVGMRLLRATQVERAV